MDEEQKEYIVNTIEFYEDMKDMSELSIIDISVTRVGIILFALATLINTLDIRMSASMINLVHLLMRAGLAELCGGLILIFLKLVDKLNFIKEKNKLLKEFENYLLPDSDFDTKIVNEIYDAMKNENDCKLYNILDQINNEDGKKYTLNLKD